MASYAAAYRTPNFYRRGFTNALSLVVRDGSGEAATVASGTITVREGTRVAVDGAAITPGASGEATYSLLSTAVPDTLPYSTRWSEQWDLTLDDGTVLSYVRDAHLVRAKPEPRIDAADLLRRHSDIATQYTLAQAQVFVDEAWDTIIGRMVSDGRYPQHVLSTWALAEPHMLLSLAFLFRSASTYTAGGGKYATLATEYAAEFESLWGKVSWMLDTDEDGVADGSTAAAEPVVLLFEPPPRWGLW